MKTAIKSWFFILIPFICGCQTYVLKSSLLKPTVPLKRSSAFFNWTEMGNSHGYLISTDSDKKYGKQVAFKITKDSLAQNPSFGAIDFVIPVPKYGAEIVISAAVKVKDVKNGYAGLWCRQDIKYGHYARFYNMSDRQIRGTQDWMEHEFTIPVEKGISELHFGGLLTNDGTAWFANFKVLIDGKPIKLDKALVTNLTKAPNKKSIDWINEHSIDFNNDDETSFEFLDDLVKDKRVVLIGEQTHACHEFQTFRNNAFKHLAEKGFTLLGYEDESHTGFAINWYINEADASMAEYNILNAFTHDFYKTEENRLFIDQLRHNRNQSIQFFGLDVQEPYRAIGAIASTTFSCLPALYDDAMSLLDTLNGISPSNLSKSLVDYTKQELQKMEAQVGLESTPCIPYLKYLIHSAYQNMLLVDEQDFIERRKLRDSLMAENIVYILETFPEQKIVVFAHNAHVENNYFSLGRHLRNKLSADDMLIIGSATGGGRYGGNNYQERTFTTDLPLTPAQPGSYEYACSLTGKKAFVIDLREAAKNESNIFTIPLKFRVIGSLEDNKQFTYQSVGLADRFDILVYFEKTTPVQIKK